jgi:uncharacterized membrane protein YkoI
MGPSSVAVADQQVWIGNRGDNRLLGFDARTLAASGAIQLDAMPDALAYVPRSRELWLTTPSDKEIKVISVAGKTPKKVADIKVDGSPECIAVDDARGVFYTNLEDKDRTLAIDVGSRKVVDGWPSGCGAEGPRGLALDPSRRLLFVACTDGADVLDLAHGGKMVGTLKTGGGVDAIEYDAGRRRLFVASGKDGVLAVAGVAENGTLTLEATVQTSKGARNPVIDARGTVYVEDSERRQLLVIDVDAVVRGMAVREQEPGLLATAKVGPEDAISTAKAKLPSARLVSAEIEREHRKLIYSFDFKTEGLSGRDEVTVDALTGKVLGIKHESGADEAKEKAADTNAAGTTRVPAAR